MTQPPRRAFEILIAEDNSCDMLLVREALDQQEISCNLRTVSDGAAAIALIEQLDQEPQSSLDLVIVDMHLPRYDGTAILERLRSSAHLKATPVIVLSGLPADRIYTQTMKYGLVHPFNKPADFMGFMALGVLVTTILKPEMQAHPEEPPAKTMGNPA